MGQLAELFMVGLVIIGGYYVYKHPEIIEQIKNELGNIGNKGGGTETTEETTTEEPAKEETKAKYVAVYASKSRSLIRIPSTIY